MINKITRKIKCNDCESSAEYSIVIKKKKRNQKLNLCKDCLVLLYFEISKTITPKSPKNILNKF